MSLIRWENFTCVVLDRPLFKPISGNGGGGVPICFLGPSGRGKTSLLRALAGFSNRFQGEVFWDNLSLQSFSVRAKAAWREASLRAHFQNQVLFSELTVMDNILLVMPKEKNSSAIPWINEQAKALGIDCEALAGNLSWGERQRAALIRSFAGPSKCVLIDEPFSSLDSKTVHRVAVWLEEKVVEQGVQLLVTGHEAQFALQAQMVELEAWGE